VSHRGGGGGEGFGAAEADGELGDLQRIEESEGLTLAALEIEREGRSRAGAVAIIDVALAAAFL